MPSSIPIRQAAAILVASLFTACSGGSSGPVAAGGPSAIPVSGRVVDQFSGAGIAGIAVSVGSARGVTGAGGEDRGLVVAFEDITENVQSQRVLAWGEMARQVAHEIKNPLTPMKLSLQHLERVMADRRPDFETVFRENLDLVLDEIDRLEAIAGSFARFAVPQPAGSAPFDAVAVAQDVIDLYATGEGAIEYRLRAVGAPRSLLGEPEEFRRVLVNLVQNARDAIVAGTGRGAVELRFDWTGPPETALVSVLDDGVGLPAEGVERLFEPSFSTKTRGTGLGLAITRRVVEAWGRLDRLGAP